MRKNHADRQLADTLFAEKGWEFIPADTGPDSLGSVGVWEKDGRSYVLEMDVMAGTYIYYNEGRMLFPAKVLDRMDKGKL